MDFSTGLFRVKAVWAALCGLIGLGAILMLSQAQLPSETFGRMVLGIGATTVAAGGTPFLKETLKNKVAILCGGVLGGLSFANGKWPDGAIAAALIAGFIWTIWSAVSWVINGFTGKQRQ
jgi:hypothetical protein